MNFRFYYLFLVFTALVLDSCQQLEDDMIVLEEIEEELGNTDPDETETTPEDTTQVVPCDFDFETIEPNTALKFTCSHDLKGKTISIPENVKLHYGEGAQLYNGTLILNNHTIDGRLLNCELTVEGPATLLDNTFTFDPKKWCIVQGKVDDNTALNNRKNMNAVIELAHSFGAEVFEIDEFDAYFSVFGTVMNQLESASHAIRIPSNFHFKMSNNTYLRMQPSNGFIYYLLHASLGQNITISGGHLIGDRYEHDYSPTTDWLNIDRSTHEYGACIMLAGVEHVVVDGVTMSKSAGDGILCMSSVIRYADGSPREGSTINTDITIRNCTISENRRNNISLTDGDGYLIENCTITDAGLDVPSNPQANGTPPRASIDMEAYRETEVVDGVEILIEYEKLDKIVIRGNTFTGNRIGLLFFTVSNALVEDNFFDDGMGSVNANNCTVRNNTFVKGENMELSRAVSFTSFIRNGEEEAVNNEISGNIIKGYQIGMNISGKNAQVFNNKVFDFQTGIHIGHLEDTKIFNNEYSSDRTVAYGYYSLEGTCKNVVLTNEKMDVNNRVIFLNKINEKTTDDKYQLIFDKCSFNSQRELYFKDCNNITIQNSIMNVKVVQINSTNILEINNTTY